MPFTLDAILRPYDTYSQKVRYLWNNGTISLPIAGPIGSPGSPPPPPGPGNAGYRQAAAVGQVNAPQGFKIVMWQAQRRGDFPFVPAPTPASATNGNEVLLDTAIDVWTPVLLGDETTFVTGSSGVYVYALYQPIWATDDAGVAGGLRFGSNPHENSLAVNNFPPAAFQPLT